MREKALVDLIQYCIKMGRNGFVFYTFCDTYDQALVEMEAKTRNVTPLEIMPLEDGIYMVTTQVEL